MAAKDIVAMSQEELKRTHVIKQALDCKLSQVKAAELLRLSSRQVRRIIKRVRQGGEAAVAHRSRGRPSNRRLPETLKRKVLKLYEKKYYDFGPTLANEKLFEKDKIKLGTQTLRNWLIGSGKWQLRLKRRQYRQWRERRECVGELVQMDGSHHDWSEGRGPWCVLMGYIDDASNRTYARFYEYEGTMPAMDSFKRYAKKRGIPHAIYLDKHNTYKSPAKQTIKEEIAGIRPMSEFERAMDELNVAVIHANSPQAKGRIERLFRTFQDRVVKEMRLQGVKTIEEANIFLEEYLPVYNRRFSKEPASSADMHRPAGGINIDAVLCFKQERVLRNDYTVMHGRKIYQILDRTTAKQVVIEDRLNGKRHISYNGKKLKYKSIEHRSAKEEPKPVRKWPVLRQQHGWKPLYVGYGAVKKAQKKALEEVDELISANT
jgi:transposase-like protein